MILKIFAVRDAAVEAFLQPFFSPSTGAAIRSLQEAVNDPKHEFSKHAKDYSLWELGSFDDAIGAVTGGIPAHYINCVDLLNKA